MTELQRTPAPQLVTIGATTGAATTIDKGRATTGSFQIPSGSSTTSVTIYSQLVDGAGWAIPQEDGSPIPAITVAAGEIHLLPDAIYKLPNFKLVGDVATASVPVWLTS